MSTPSSARIPAPHLLVVEDDSDLRAVLNAFLEEEGYIVTPVASLDAALDRIAVTAFDCILTDLLTYGREQPLSSARTILHAASPTPIVILTAWPLQADIVQSEGFTALIQKPFDVDQLLVSVAAATQVAFTPEQERQRKTVLRYFAALNARDWDALVSLCTETVVYVLPGETPFSGTITGKAAFRAYSEATFQHFADTTFEGIHIFALPRHLSARYVGHWRQPGSPDGSADGASDGASDGAVATLSGAVRFSFDGDRIRQVGVQLNEHRLRALGWGQ